MTCTTLFRSFLLVSAVFVLLPAHAEAGDTPRGTSLSLVSMRNQTFKLLKSRKKRPAMPRGFRVLHWPTKKNQNIRVMATKGGRKVTRTFQLESLSSAKGLVPLSSVIELKKTPNGLARGDRIIYSWYTGGRVTKSVRARVSSLERNDAFNRHFAKYKAVTDGCYSYHACPVPSYSVEVTARHPGKKGREDLGSAHIENYVQRSKVIYVHGETRFPIFAGVVLKSPGGTRQIIPSKEKREFTSLSQTLEQSTRQLIDGASLRDPGKRVVSKEPQRLRIEEFVVF
jgi:hypothetical protein